LSQTEIIDLFLLIASTLQLFPMTHLDKMLLTTKYDQGVTAFCPPPVGNQTPQNPTTVYIFNTFYILGFSIRLE
jgi:hypothetical protein